MQLSPSALGLASFHRRRGQTTTPHSPGLLLSRKVACLQREREVHPTLGQGRARHTYWNLLVYRIFWREKVEGDGEWQEGVPSSTTLTSQSHQWRRGHKGKEAGGLWEKYPVGTLHAWAAHSESVAWC